MRKRSLFLTVLLSVAILIGGLGCQTIFSPDPPAHDLLKAIEDWPDEYYWLIQTGVSSRMLGLRQRGDRPQEALARVEKKLDAVKDQWANLSGLNSAQSIIDYLNANNLEDVAGAIRETLDANQAQAPSRSTHAFLQARAIKQGLIRAHRDIKKNRG